MHTPLWQQPVLRRAAGQTLRPGGFRLTDRAADFIGLLPGWRVLDVGSGLGATVNRLRSRYGAKAYGVEPCAAQIRDTVPTFGVVRALGHVLPFGGNSFQALFCECVLSLFDEPQQGLEEFSRVLRPGGFLVLSDLFIASSLNGNSTTDTHVSCTERAAPIFHTRKMVGSAGFEVLLEEDHSHHLKEMAAHLLFAADDTSAPCACKRPGLGYYLMIARKQESEQGRE